MRTVWQWLVGLPGPVLGGIVLIGAFLSALGSFLVLARQSRISEGIRTHVQQNLEQTQENLQHTRETLQHTRDAVARIEDVIGHITGGDSYCYLEPDGFNEAESTVRWRVEVKSPGKEKGRYSLPEVSAHIIDRDSSEPPTEETLPLGPLSVNSDNPVYYVPITLRKAYRLTIHFRTKYAFFTQTLTLRRPGDGHWTVASRVVRDGNVIPGSETIDHDFPRDKHGKPQW